MARLHLMDRESGEHVVLECREEDFAEVLFSIDDAKYHYMYGEFPVEPLVQFSDPYCI